MTDQERSREGEGEREDPAAFARLADEPSPGLLREYFGFLRHTGKWWLLPIFIVLGLIGGLVILGGSGVAPFLYALF